MQFAQKGLSHEDREKREFVVLGNERPLTGIGLMKDRYPEFDVSSIDYRLRAIRTSSHKLIWKINGGSELFNVKDDPGELNDLAKTNVPVRNRLNSMLISWMNRTPAYNIGILQSQDEESLKILRSLGYVE